MPYIDVHIDVDEFYDQLDRRDKKELVEYLTLSRDMFGEYIEVNKIFY